MKKPIVQNNSTREYAINGPPTYYGTPAWTISADGDGLKIRCPGSPASIVEVRWEDLEAFDLAIRMLRERCAEEEHHEPMPKPLASLEGTL